MVSISFDRIWTTAKAALTVTLVFEVVDDPLDASEYRTYLKPLNVRLLFFQPPPPAFPVPVNSYDKNKHCLPNITKQTPRDLHEWKGKTGDRKADGAYVYVLAEATEQWKGLYGSGQYRLQMS
ncbi:MAG TPA: hypothetical protein VI455_16250 [Terriglobia bacterium]